MKEVVQWVPGITPLFGLFADYVIYCIRQTIALQSQTV